mgnify:CR=1 FL=1
MAGPICISAKILTGIFFTENGFPVTEMEGCFRRNISAGAEQFSRIDSVSDGKGLSHIMMSHLSYILSNMAVSGQ